MNFLKLTENYRIIQDGEGKNWQQSSGKEERADSNATEDGRSLGFCQCGQSASGSFGNPSLFQGNLLSYFNVEIALFLTLYPLFAEVH